MHFLHDPFWGNKLHVVICIRDNVWASICTGEHHTRYVNTDHIKMLVWDYAAIEYFMDRKVRNLPDSAFSNPSEKSLEKWLGTDIIHNNHRKIDEPVSQYIIRHTRLLPRDIVVMGNELDELKLYLQKLPQADRNALIREKVSKCAKTFGEELLQICANQVNNNAMPSDAGAYNYTEVYTSITDYRDSTVNVMKTILRKATSDKLTWNQIQEMEQMANDLICPNASMFDILWQNVGIGYVEEGPNGVREVFFNQEIPEFLLPKGKETYLLRSCLIDAAGIERTEWDSDPVMGGESPQSRKKANR